MPEPSVSHSLFKSNLAELRNIKLIEHLNKINGLSEQEL